MCKSQVLVLVLVLACCSREAGLQPFVNHAVVAPVPGLENCQQLQDDSVLVAS